jgi:hypothetical protein
MKNGSETEYRRKEIQKTIGNTTEDTNKRIMFVQKDKMDWIA